MRGLYYFAQAIGFLPLLIYIINKKKGSTNTLLILPFLWLVPFASLYELIGTNILRIETEVWFKVYTLLETASLAYFFYLLLNRHYKIFFALCSFGFLALFISLSLSWTAESNDRIDGYLQVAETLFIFCCVFLWLKRIFTDLADTSLLKVPDFYFVAGIVLYLAGGLFMFIMRDLMTKNSNISYRYYWNVIIFCNIVLRILLIIGVWKAQMNTSAIKKSAG